MSRKMSSEVRFFAIAQDYMLFLMQTNRNELGINELGNRLGGSESV